MRSYIGAKFASRTPVKITKIVPSNMEDRTITIFGDNFGQKDYVTNRDTVYKGIIAINQVKIKASKNSGKIIRLSLNYQMI